jgi:hypothetical protein
MTDDAVDIRGRRLRRVKGCPRMYLIDRTALAYPSEISALDESGSGGSAAYIYSKRDFQDSTRYGTT